MPKSQARPDIQNRIARIAALTAAALLLPLAATLLSDEVDWGVADFAIAGLLLFGAGSAFLLVGPRLHSDRHRAGAGIAIGALLLLVWAELAVGIL